MAESFGCRIDAADIGENRTLVVPKHRVENRGQKQAGAKADGIGGNHPPIESAGRNPFIAG